MKLAILILAAGMSSRMGQEKQLLTCQPAGAGPLNFLEKTLDLYRPYGSLFVVLGYGADRIRRESDLEGARIIINPHYKEGLGSSLAAGLGALRGEAYTGLIMTFCDMPHLKAETLRAFKACIKARPDDIIQADYQGKRGHPVYLPARFFSQLANVEGDKGARDIIRDNPASYWPCPVLDPAVVEDIDSQAIYERIKEREDWI